VLARGPPADSVSSNLTPHTSHLTPPGTSHPPPPRARRHQAVTRSADPYAHSVLFATLVDLGADADLLSLDGASPHLEGYLRQEGGLASMSAGGQVGTRLVGGGVTAPHDCGAPRAGPSSRPHARRTDAPPLALTLLPARPPKVGPLSPRQVRHVELLCRLHVARGRYSAAAQAYRALAERRSGR
jgi:hypothetical protein